jgi:hypothetical protein
VLLPTSALNDALRSTAKLPPTVYWIGIFNPLSSTGQTLNPQIALGYYEYADNTTGLPQSPSEAPYAHW